MRALALPERMVVVRRLRQRGEIGRFRSDQLVHRLVEIEQRGGGDAVGADAEIDLVEIELEDLLLGEGALDLHRQQRFLDLARERELVGEQEVLGDLLRDGGGALRAAAAAVLLHEQHGGARDAGEVDAAVLVEVLVLRRDEGVDDELRHRLDREVESPLPRIFGQQRAVGRVHPRHHRGLVVLQLGIVRQRLRVVPQQPGRARDPDDEYDRPGREQQADEAQHSLMAEVPPRRAAPAAMIAAAPRAAPTTLQPGSSVPGHRYPCAPAVPTATVALFYVETEANATSLLNSCPARPASRVVKKVSTACTIESAVRSRHASEISDFRSALFDT